MPGGASTSDASAGSPRGSRARPSILTAWCTGPASGSRRPAAPTGRRRRGAVWRRRWRRRAAPPRCPATSSPSRRCPPIRPQPLADLAEVAAQLLQRRPAPKPVAVVDGVDRQRWRQGEDGGRVRPVRGVGGLLQSQPRQPGAIGVGQERPARADPGPERRGDGGRIHAQRHEPRVGHLGLVLQRHQAAEEGLLLGAPPASVALQQQGGRRPPARRATVGCQRGRAGRGPETTHLDSRGRAWGPSNRMRWRRRLRPTVRAPPRRGVTRP
jgi:hypothetical protein